MCRGRVGEGGVRCVRAGRGRDHRHQQCAVRYAGDAEQGPLRRRLDVQAQAREQGRRERPAQRHCLRGTRCFRDALNRKHAMPFIPHTDADVKAMLAAIGVASIDQLFEEIPERLRAGKLTQVPEGMSEMEVARLLSARANQDGSYLNFLGAGAYEHHIPAAVWEIVTRGEFYSAYTPYQAEASQGTLQLLYEYQTMMASLTGMDVSNASLYDGASGLAEAVLMAVREHTRTAGTGKKAARRILMPSTVHPVYRRVAHAIVRHQDIELVEIPH